jgi:hypothetical protein
MKTRTRDFPVSVADISRAAKKTREHLRSAQFVVGRMTMFNAMMSHIKEVRMGYRCSRPGGTLEVLALFRQQA